MNENHNRALRMQRERRRQRLKREQRQRQLFSGVVFLMALCMLLIMLIAVVGEADRAAEAQAATIIWTRRETLPELPPEAIEAKEEVAPVQPAEGIPMAEPVPELSEAVPEVSEKDLWWMAHLLAGECQGGSRELQEATGSVVLNRIADKEFPDTLAGVITQTKPCKQYACYWDGNFWREPTERNWEVARYLLEHGSQIPESIIYQSQRRQGPLWKKIDREYFCSR